MLVSVATMFRRFLKAIKHAAKEESFAAVFGAAITLVIIGTVTYTLGEGWNLARRVLLRRLHADHVEHR